MSSPFGARRKARVVGQEDEPSDSPMTGTDSSDPEPVFKRPTNKSKKRSSMRLSFGPGGTSMDEEKEDPTQVFTPKKSSLSRQAAERNALRKTASLASLRRSGDAPTAGRDAQGDRPRYSREHLAELKSSTPSTPRSEKEYEDGPSAPNSAPPAGGGGGGGVLDVAAKFGSDLTRYERFGATAIPSEAEIAEKKARRARLAKEQKYKSTVGSGSGSEDGTGDDDNFPQNRDSDEDEFRSHRDVISLSDRKKPSKHPDATARLAADDDEDLLDDSVQYGGSGGGTASAGGGGGAGRIMIGRAAEKERAARERARRAEQIDEAQHSDSDSDSSLAGYGGEDDGEGAEEGERDRRAAYDHAQARAGLSGLYLDPAEKERRERKEGNGGARTPPRMAPLPTLGGIAEKLARRVQELEGGIAAKVRGLEDTQREKAEIGEQEAAIQSLLDEVGERWKALHRGEEVDAEVAMDDIGARPSFGGGMGFGAGLGFGSAGGAGLGSRFGVNGEDRGLESIGGTPVRGSTASTSLEGTASPG